MCAPYKILYRSGAHVDDHAYNYCCEDCNGYPYEDANFARYLITGTTGEFELIEIGDTLRFIETWADGFMPCRLSRNIKELELW